MKYWCVIIACFLLPITVNATDTAVWLEPSEDIVGTGTVARPNGIRDWHIRIDSPSLGGVKPAAWRVRGGLWYSMTDRGQWRAPYDRGFSLWRSLIGVKQAGTRADLYLEPLLAWPGDLFEIEAVLPDGTVKDWKVICDNQTWLPGGEWLGQGPRDYCGVRKMEADGIREWELRLNNPFLGGAPSLVDVWLPYRPVGSRIRRSGSYQHWSSSPDSLYGTPMPLYHAARSEELTISINPVLATGGDELFVRVVQSDGSWAMWKIIGLGAEWETGGEWFGQEDMDYTGETISAPNGVNDWHLRVGSPRLGSVVRWIIKGANTTWEYAEPGRELTDSQHHAAYVLSSGNAADIYLDPVMERAGDIFYVSAVQADGSVLNWGVTSIHQLRSLEVAWRGQSEEHPVLYAAGSVTGVLQRWEIEVEHDLLETRRPYQWRIQRGTRRWLEPRVTDEELQEAEPILVEYDGRGAGLFIEPEFAKPGTQYEIEALFDDGSLVQWTACADGTEWAGAARLRADIGVDYVGLTDKPGADGTRDWVLELPAEALASDPPASIDVRGAGWRWHWPGISGVSPAGVDYDRTAVNVYIAPRAGERSADRILTIRAVTETGIVRYWKALRPAEE